MERDGGSLSSALKDENTKSANSAQISSSIPVPTKHEAYQKPVVYKIIILGESGVGKTCLSFRFCAGRFPTSTEATIGIDFREKVLEMDDLRMKLQLWDTAGQERFRKSVTHHYYRGANAVVLVYDVTNQTSLQQLDHWLEELEAHGIGVDIPRVLVGNKCDQGQAQVPTGVAQRWADDRNMPLFETSAMDDSQCDHVDSIFLTLALKMKNGKKLIKPVVDPNNPEIEPVRILYQSSLASPGPPPSESYCCY